MTENTSMYEPMAEQTSSESNDLFGRYEPVPHQFDEYKRPDGTVSPQWQRFMDEFTRLSAQERESAQETARRLLTEDGVTFVSHETTDGGHAPWRLDLLPFLVDASEWSALEAGLIQRATLLNSILHDVYGEQSLIKDGQIPPALVYGNPQFLHPCHGLRVRDDTHLHLLAFDMARAPDGRWWVLNDRSEAPTGLGYALENRLITSRSLPDLFASSNVMRLASVFQALHEYLVSLTRKDEPLIVVMSPGPGMETYFEHAFLARYLGYTVVEGADLSVRDDKVYLKSIEGLIPVDLIFRRTESELCDPLELRTDSQFGVPGITRAARAGNVVVTNALGSGLLENDGLSSFLPSLCRTILNEDLILPEIATWWCGQDKERDHVLNNLDSLTIHKTFSNKTILSLEQDTFHWSTMTPQQRDELISSIQREGFNYAGQEKLSMSTAPSWPEPSILKPANLTLRVFVVRTVDGYKAVPGGLTRVSDGDFINGKAANRAIYSKDTWVESSGPIDTFSLLAQNKTDARARRGSRNLPSRTADNLFWLGRYAERTESALRLYRSLVNRLGGETGLMNESRSLNLIIQQLANHKHLTAKNIKKAAGNGAAGLERDLWKILFDPDSPDGLGNVLSNVKRTADLVRERLSLDTWRIIRQLANAPDFASLRQGQEISDASRFLDQLVQYVSAFNGMVMENMTRNSGWRFLDMGRRLERAYRGTRLIRDLANEGNQTDSEWLDILLELADSTITYRTRYQSIPQVTLVLDLLLSDATNPRSVLYQFVTIGDHINNFAHFSDDSLLSQPQRTVLAIETDLKLADLEVLGTQTNKKGTLFRLNQMLNGIEQGIESLSDAIGQTYFVHSTTRQVSGPHLREHEL